MYRKNIIITTSARNEFKNITQEIQHYIDELNVLSGIAIVYVQHTTAGLTINENADPDVKADMIRQLEAMVPWTNNYRHYEGNSAAHLKASMMGFSLTLIIEKGKLLLGTWQSVYFTEFDGPRKRTVCLKVIPD